MSKSFDENCSKNMIPIYDILLEKMLDTIVNSNQEKGTIQIMFKENLPEKQYYLIKNEFSKKDWKIFHDICKSSVQDIKLEFKFIDILTSREGIMIYWKSKSNNN
jgi:hypothetical protein